MQSTPVPDPDSSNAARARWTVLVDEINRARAEYYQQDAPTLSDVEYDEKYRELGELEQEWPQLVSGESPTQTVGGQRAEMFEPVQHLQRMYSLDNAFDEAELGAWLERVEKGLGRVPDLLCELKIDGLAVDAVYVDGRLRSLATRGDGSVGEDVTYNAAYIASVPQRLSSLSGAPIPRLLEVRGEVFLPVADFERINVEQLDLGFANAARRSWRPPGPMPGAERGASRRSPACKRSLTAPSPGYGRFS
jgi:DNA ligase (NAD+)